MNDKISEKLRVEMSYVLYQNIIEQGIDLDVFYL